MLILYHSSAITKQKDGKHQRVKISSNSYMAGRQDGSFQVPFSNFQRGKSSSGSTGSSGCCDWGPKKSCKAMGFHIWIWRLKIKTICFHVSISVGQHRCQCWLLYYIAIVWKVSRKSKCWSCWFGGPTAKENRSLRVRHLISNTLPKSSCKANMSTWIHTSDYNKQAVLADDFSKQSTSCSKKSVTIR